MRWLAAILILPVFVSAQTNSLEKISGLFEFGTRDTNYIKQFEKQHNLQFSSWLNSVIFSISPAFTNSSANSISVAPNLYPQAGISLGLRYFSLSASYNLPVSVYNITEFGQTRFFDLGLSYYNGYAASELKLNFFRGLHQKNNDLTYVRSDAHLNSVGLNLYYVNNYKKFSLRSAIKMQELQYKSAGSFIFMLSTGLRNIKADTAFVKSNTNLFGPLENASHLNQLHVSLRPGYAYNLSFKKGKYFIKPAFFIGAGITRLIIENNIDNKRFYTIDYDLHNKLAVGYNGSDFFFNVYTEYDATLNLIEQNKAIEFNQLFIGFNAGWRFNSFLTKYPWL